jgi:hypothetical protein
VIATTAHTGLDVGLVVTALGLGFRHGIDWDHIAAITDITGSQDTPRASLFYATCYFVGHALVIAILGVVAIVASEHLPASVDVVMERVVGITLLLLGVYIGVSLFRNGRDFRMRSRWMIMIVALRKLTAQLHPHRLALEPDVVSSGASTSAHRHMHHFASNHDTNPLTGYGVGAATGIGVLHGMEPKPRRRFSCSRQPAAPAAQQTASSCSERSSSVSAPPTLSSPPAVPLVS